MTDDERIDTSVPDPNPDPARTGPEAPTDLGPDEDDEPPHLQHGSPHPNEPAPYDPPNPNVP